MVKLSYSSEQTKERILSCARREFLEHGYEKANLRRIANEAMVTTGALYSHFTSKEDLFDALVRAPSEELLAVYERLHESAAKMPLDLGFEQVKEISEDGMNWMLEYIYEHFDAFKLVICHSEGTSYSEYVDKLIEIEERTTKSILPEKMIEETGDFFIHVVCSSGLHDFFEMVSHDIPKEEAIKYMAKVREFRFGGWKVLLESADKKA